MRRDEVSGASDELNGFDVLSEELLWLILEELPSPDVLALGCCNRWLNAVCSSEGLWQYRLSFDPGESEASDGMSAMKR